MNSSLFAWLLICLFGAVTCQPLFGLEKQLLYSFQDPDEFEIINKRSPLLSLVGSNIRFTDPYRNRVLNKKKIRSVDESLMFPNSKIQLPSLPQQ